MTPRLRYPLLAPYGLPIGGGTGTGGSGGAISAGTTFGTLGTVEFDNGNGVTFGMDGQTVTASVDGQGVIHIEPFDLTLGTVTFADQNGVSWGAVGSVITASVNTNWSVNFSAGTTSSGLAAVTFSNSNNVSFGLNAGAGVITASASFASAQQSINFSAGTTSNNLSAVTFSNSNGVSFGLNAGTLTGSIATSLTNIRVSAGTTSNLLSAVTFADSNGISFGINASTITASYTVPSFDPPSLSAGTSSKTFGQMVFSNSNGISFGLNGNTITASASGGGGGAPTINFYDNFNGTGGGGATLPVPFNSLYVVPFNVRNFAFPGNMTVNTFILPMFFNHVATSQSSSFSSSLSVGIYTRSGSTLNLLNSLASTYALAAATDNSTLFNGNRFWTVDKSLFSTDWTLSAGGEYYLGMLWGSSNYNGNLPGIIVQNAFNSTRLQGSVGVGATNTAAAFLNMPFLGSYNVATTGALPASIVLSQISNTNALYQFGFNNVVSSY